jgi:YVTN family beta-propeller protein
MKQLTYFPVIFLGLIFFIILFYLLAHSPTFKQKEDPDLIYAHTRIGMLSKQIKDDPYLVYVPNSFSNTVFVIDPTTYQVIDKFITGKNPQHIVPSYDLQTLWVLNDLGNSLTPINPKTGKPGTTIAVADPYNLYFTPDGRYAIVMAEAQKRFDFRDSHTMALIESVPVNCKGLNHLDYTADGRFALASCEFSGELVKLDMQNRKVVGYIKLDSCAKPHSMPQDIRLSPDGRTFYVADMMLNGVFLIDARNFRQIGFIATGKGAHSIYPSRDARFFYIGNRGCNNVNRCSKKGPGSISVIDPIRQKIIANWPIPGGGSPDMGNLTPDGKELWLSGRYDGEVYVFDTITGKLKHRIKVGAGPHGLTVWPQPGRYSLGHTGNMR